ncbi:hypothetical protein BAUCODRAFT_541495 [Baudoinia panamericana UAMH 10762]|uniref:Dynactin subunit 2 n=1 Tax=Baudoinia panamericana (strain UAMH 10762) TaxID=717646 RepID=M2N9D8_BAUPA|nr:uncharacterized protein BAUCODRAFT_541495 [Baudoinia panamericana UAMH 10762]EMC95430.1 hypothetical protein BAUCODRAFT_541495 [Baudoinia panamericana UAMH 10762]
MHPLSSLPGYDTAPDVYETAAAAADPAAEDTVSSLPTTAGSGVETDATTEDDESGTDDEGGHGISHRRLHPLEARARFRETEGLVRVGRGVEFGDRIGRKGTGTGTGTGMGRARGYRVRKRRDGDEEEEEGLEKRIARLRREVEECRALAEAERENEEVGGTEGQGGEGRGEGHEGGEGKGEGVEGLSRMLAAIEVPEIGRRGGWRGDGADGRATVLPSRAQEEGDHDEQMLRRVSDFDARLATLEQALGLASLDSTVSDTVAAPVLPSLAMLDQQLSALTTATSLSQLEAAGSRIRNLKIEAEQARATTNGEVTEGETVAALSSEDVAKLQKLYELLPALQASLPVVPSMLARLRSLRTLHTTAASAASELEELEQRQTETEKEIKAWREGLERVERAVGEASESNGRNGKVVEGWVKELEERMNGLR